MTFDYRALTIYAPAFFQVGYSMTDDNVDNFDWSDDVFFASIEEWTTFQVEFPQGTKYAAIRYNVDNENRMWVDNFVFSTSTCAIPTFPKPDVVTANTIQLSWEGNNNSYNLRYMPLEVMDFETEEEGWYSTTWTRSNDYGGYESDYCVSSLMDHSDEDLVLSSVVLDGSISFYARCVEEGGWFKDDEIDYAQFDVIVSVGGMNHSLTDNELILATELDWVRYTFDLSVFNGQTGDIIIRHHYNKDLDYVYYLFVDDITIFHTWIPVNSGFTIHEGNERDLVSYTLSELQEETNYAIEVKGICGNGESSWTPTLYVATQEEGICSYYKRITGYTGDNDHYYLIASPVVDSIEPSEGNGFLTSEYDLYSFDQSAVNEEWRNYKVMSDVDTTKHANFSKLVSGTGYLYASQGNTTLVFTGTLYNDTGEVAVSKTSTTTNLAGMNLIGNPFGEIAYLATASTGGMALASYRMNENGDGFIANASTEAIAPMEGVFYYASENGNVYFTTTEPTPSGLLNVNLNQANSLIDRAIVCFDKGNTLKKFSFREGSTKIYIPQDGKDYAVANACTVDEVPVNFKAEKSGKYVISVDAENVELGYLHLIDNLTGADINLLVEPNYTFEANASDYASRFKLVFATGSTVTDDNFCFVNNGTLIVLGVEGEATLQVVDVMGRMLSSESFSGSYEKHLNVVPGVYMIRLINGNDVKVQKIIIK